MHGFAITERTEQITRDVLRVEAGSAVPGVPEMRTVRNVEREWIRARPRPAAISAAPCSRERGRERRAVSTRRRRCGWNS